MSFADRIKEQREFLNLTQEELSYRIHEDLSRQSISKWERGEAYPDVENLLSLASALEMTFDEMFEDELSARKLLDSDAAETDKEIAITNPLPENWKNEYGHTVQFSSITAFLREMGSLKILTLTFEGIVTSYPGSINDYRIDYKLFESENRSIDGSRIRLRNMSHNEQFIIVDKLYLHDLPSDTCSIRFF